MDDVVIRILRSRRRTLSLEITREGEVLARAPMRMPEREIRNFAEKKSEWIRSRLQKVRSQIRTGESMPLSGEELKKLSEAARRELPALAAVYARKMGVSYGRITVRSQVSRWGSCSTAGNLNFNCLLMLAPEEVREYVVVHELAHRKHMDHSRAFWGEVAAVLPDYAERERWLKEYGSVLQQRMRLGKATEDGQYAEKTSADDKNVHLR